MIEVGLLRVHSQLFSMAVESYMYLFPGAISLQYSRLISDKNSDLRFFYIIFVEVGFFLFLLLQVANDAFYALMCFYNTPFCCSFPRKAHSLNKIYKNLFSFSRIRTDGGGLIHAKDKNGVTFKVSANTQLLNIINIPTIPCYCLN